MKAMIDTNVILDVYLEREPFYPIGFFNYISLWSK
jgi:hypothetical protein